MGHSVIKEPEAAKVSLGVVPQDIALYLALSARENLIFWGKMFSLRGKTLKSRVDAVLEMIGLTSRQKDRISTFSGGMKRRINLGVALLPQPDVVIMDEPTIGIDPQSRRHILDNIKELNRQGMTVLYTTHYLEEAAELSDRIAIMDMGKVIAYGTHNELIKLIDKRTRIDLSLNAEASTICAVWKRIEGVTQINAIDGIVTVLVDDSNRVLAHLFETASKANVHIKSMSIQEPDLETVFLHLTGRALRD